MADGGVDSRYRGMLRMQRISSRGPTRALGPGDEELDGETTISVKYLNSL